MLIGNSSKRPNLEKVRRIKSVLYEVLQLPDDSVVTVSELACLEEACAPFETVIGLLRPGKPQCQHKVHKAVEDINAQDIVQVCTVWGFDVQKTNIEPLLISNHITRRTI